MCFLYCTTLCSLLPPVSLFYGYSKCVLYMNYKTYLLVKSTLHHTSVPQPHPFLLFPWLLPPSLAFIPSAGCPRWWPHNQLPAGEVPRCPPEPWGEELSHFLPADRGRGGGSAEAPGPGEEPSAVPVPGQSTNLALNRDKNWQSYFGSHWFLNETPINLSS